MNLAKIKNFAVFTDVLLPILLYISLNHQNQLISWILAGTLTAIRLSLVIIEK